LESQARCVLADGAQVKGRLCPICDAQVPAGARNCPSCSTDLALFDVPTDSSDAKMENKDNVDKILLELEKGQGDKALEGLKGIGSNGASKPAANSSGAVVMAVFQCPECGADVPTTSNACPKCGVQFAGAQMYECPLCKTMMDATVTTCPGCGAVFEAVEEPPAAQPPAQPPVPQNAEAAVAKPSVPEPRTTQPSTESKPQATQPKAPEPAQEEHAPMSFVERMKMLRAQKEGGPAPGQPARPATQPAARPQQAPAAQPQNPAQPSAVQVHSAPGSQPVRPPQGVAPAAARPIQPTSGGEAMRQLPAMVAKIKEDFALAKRLDVDVTAAKDLINRAVAAGRGRDLKAAVELVSQGESEVERVFTTHIAREIITLEKQAKEVHASGIDVAGIMAQVAKGRAASAERRWAGAVSALEQARDSLGSMATEYFAAQKGLSSIKLIIEDAAALRIDLGEGRTLYDDCLKATVRRDWDTAKMLSEQCGEHFNKILPAYIANEMRKAKTKLLEVKMMNVSISKPVGHLKEANNQIKDGDYGAALHSIRQFRDAMAELDASA